MTVIQTTTIAFDPKTEYNRIVEFEAFSRTEKTPGATVWIRKNSETSVEFTRTQWTSFGESNDVVLPDSKN